MTRLTQTLIATGLISQALIAAQTEEDKSIQELRRQAALTRNIKRSTLQVKSNVEQVRNKMLLSGVIGEDMISSVDLVLSKAANAGDNALQDAIKNLVLALDTSGRKEIYLKNATESQKIALNEFEDILEEARKKADKARTEAKLEDLLEQTEQLNEDTQELEQQQAEGEEIDQEKLDELAEKQKEISDLAEQVEKELEELQKQEEELAKEDEQPEDEDKGEMAEKSDEIAEQIEDGKIEEAVKNQQEMIEQLKEMAGKMDESPEEQNAENEDSDDDSNQEDLQELEEDVEEMIAKLDELEASGKEGSELEESEELEDIKADAEDMANSEGMRFEKEIAQSMDKAGESLENGDIEEARQSFERIKEIIQRKGGSSSGEKGPQKGGNKMVMGDAPSQQSGEGSKKGEKMPEMDMQTQGEGQGKGQGQQANNSNQKSENEEGQSQKSGQGSSGKPGKGGGSKEMANALEKGEESKGSSWAKQHKEFEGQKMQQLVDEAPAEYRDLVKQYYEALARTK